MQVRTPFFAEYFFLSFFVSFYVVCTQKGEMKTTFCMPAYKTEIITDSTNRNIQCFM